VVGDGSTPATLQLLGGTYSFADGLVVANNATVTGCGTILGSITNHGTIATNCGRLASPSRAPRRQEPLRRFSLRPSTVPITCSNTRTRSTTPVDGDFARIVGNGSITNKADTNATTQSRFYRIRVQ